MINYFKLKRLVWVGFSLSVLLASNAWATDQEDFLLACKNDNQSTVSSLLAKGIDPNTPDSTGTPALVLATNYNANNVVKLLISQPKINVNDGGQASETALAVAALRNNRELVDLLLAKGANLDHPADKPGWTALHYAASEGHLEMVKYLLSKKASLDAPSANKTTPIMMAARARQTHVVKALLEAGANPSLANEAGFTAADYLDRHNETDLAAELRKKK
jgi:uncharacterized protein